MYQISEGQDIWDSSVPSVIDLLIYVTSTFLSFGSNIKITERYLSKDETMANLYAMVRSYTALQFQEDANEKLASRTRS